MQKMKVPLTSYRVLSDKVSLFYKRKIVTISSAKKSWFSPNWGMNAYYHCYTAQIAAQVTSSKKPADPSENEQLMQ
ncbi:MAG: hypothetical protein AAF629_11590 [Chloroflexota bacterium]